MVAEHALLCEAHDIVVCPRFAAMVEDVIEGTGQWGLNAPPLEVDQ